MDAAHKRQARMRRHVRVRKRISGSPERPRLAVYRSNRHIYAQLVDDATARTIASASDLETGDTGASGKTERAKAVGKLIATRAKDAGVSAAVFDRGGRLYHGRVAALADAAREEGLTI